jgi:DNA modification methylase
VNEIIKGDCLEVMKRFSDESFDLVLTDPPYGVGADSGVGGFGVSRDKARHYNDNWDTRPS